MIIFGIIFLVIGISLYLVPLQVLNARTTTSGSGSTDVRTSSAAVTIPIGWSIAAAIIGFALIILGLAISDPVIIRNTASARKDSYEKVETKAVEDRDGIRHKVVRESTEYHKAG